MVLSPACRRVRSSVIPGYVMSLRPAWLYETLSLKRERQADNQHVGLPLWEGSRVIQKMLGWCQEGTPGTVQQDEFLPCTWRGLWGCLVALAVLVA